MLTLNADTESKVINKKYINIEWVGNKGRSI